LASYAVTRAGSASRPRVGRHVQVSEARVSRRLGLGSAEEAARRAAKSFWDTRTGRPWPPCGRRRDAGDMRRVTNHQSISRPGRFHQARAGRSTIRAYPRCDTRLTRALRSAALAEWGPAA
jgi:hypothetical protein